MENWERIIANCIENGVPTLRCIPAVFQNLLQAAFLFAGVTAVIFVIYSGYKFINSHGDPKQIEAAKQTLTYAVFGLLVILLAVLIINLISYFTKVNCIKEFGFSNCQ